MERRQISFAHLGFRGFHFQGLNWTLVVTLGPVPDNRPGVGNRANQGLLTTVGERNGPEGPKALGTLHDSCDALLMWTDQHGSELLPLAECVRMLVTASKKGLTGRLGISTQRAPIVQPVNFTFHDHRIVVRLGSGHMADIVSGALVAFEVDHRDRDAHVAWSVLVRGLATPLEGAERLALGDNVPTPLVPSPGNAVFAIRLDVVTGRRFPLDEAKAEPTRRHLKGD